MKTQNLSILLTATVILGLFIAFAGSASADSPAVVNATIEGTVAISLTTAIGGDSNCSLTNTTAVDFKPGDIGATHDEGVDNVSDDYIIIVNSGSLFVDIAAYSEADFFTGGSITTPRNQYVKAVDNETSSTKAIAAGTYAALSNVSTAASRNDICQGLDWDDSTDSINIHIQLTVPDDASATTYSNTITVVAAEDTGENNQAKV